MATYALSGSGVQALSTNVTALHVTVTTSPPAAGVGTANPANGYNVGLLRFGDGVGYFDALQVVGGPQWTAVPNGTTQLGYTIKTGGAVSVVEVIGGTPPFGGGGSLAGLSDVALASLADAQVLTYQASSSKWINATPTGGSGFSATVYRQTLSVAAATVRFPASGNFPSGWGMLRCNWYGRGTQSTGGVVNFGVQVNGGTTNDYELLTGNGATASASFTGSSSRMLIGQLACGGSSAAQQVGMGEFRIGNPVPGSYLPEVMATWGVTGGRLTGNIGVNMMHGTAYSAGTAINSITLLCDAGNVAAGTSIGVYLEP